MEDDGWRVVWCVRSERVRRVRVRVGQSRWVGFY
jgi:hypothetical protein